MVHVVSMVGWLAAARSFLASVGLYSQYLAWGNCSTFRENG
jgi:hypothetical protein